jgi:hypothetical protein
VDGRSRSLRIKAGALGLGAILATWGAALPWVWVGHSFLRGYQGDGKISGILALVSMGLALAIVVRGRVTRAVRYAVVLSGVVVAGVAIADLVFLLTRSITDSTVRVLDLSAAAISQGEDAARLGEGIVSLPADLFLFGITRGDRLPAFVERAQQVSTGASRVLASLEHMSLVPTLGSGVLLSVVAGGLVLLVGLMLPAKR